MHPRTTVLLGVILVAGSGCSRPAPHAEPTPAPTSTQQQTGDPPVAAPEVTRCPPKDGRTIEIFVGSISCDEAYGTVASYNWQGQKYQEIDALTCYTGTAQTAPVVLVCSSGDVEFTAKE